MRDICHLVVCNYLIVASCFTYHAFFLDYRMVMNTFEFVQHSGTSDVYWSVCFNTVKFHCVADVNICIAIQCRSLAYENSHTYLGSQSCAMIPSVGYISLCQHKLCSEMHMNCVNTISGPPGTKFVRLCIRCASTKFLVHHAWPIPRRARPRQRRHAHKLAVARLLICNL